MWCSQCNEMASSSDSVIHPHRAGSDDPFHPDRRPLSARSSPTGPPMQSAGPARAPVASVPREQPLYQLPIRLTPSVILHPGPGPLGDPNPPAVSFAPDTGLTVNAQLGGLGVYPAGISRTPTAPAPRPPGAPAPPVSPVIRGRHPWRLAPTDGSCGPRRSATPEPRPGCTGSRSRGRRTVDDGATAAAAQHELAIGRDDDDAEDGQVGGKVGREHRGMRLRRGRRREKRDG